jgi:RNase H-like domain found in reverse transcriptase
MLSRRLAENRCENIKQLNRPVPERSMVCWDVVDGEEKPVFFCSRTLSKAEKNYPILHREALAIVFSLEKYYKYVFGLSVTVYTDHKPLISILAPKRGEPPVVATRLQRYIYRLSIFDYTVK